MLEYYKYFIWGVPAIIILFHFLGNINLEKKEPPTPLNLFGVKDTRPPPIPIPQDKITLREFPLLVVSGIGFIIRLVYTYAGVLMICIFPTLITLWSFETPLAYFFGDSGRNSPRELLGIDGFQFVIWFIVITLIISWINIVCWWEFICAMWGDTSI